MQIIKAENSIYPVIQDFLIPHEAFCITLCSLVRKLDNHIYVACKNPNIKNSSDIFAVFYIDGSVLHCIPQISDELLNAFCNFCQNLKIKNINGEKSASDALIKSLEKIQKPFQINQYKLMNLEKIAAEPPESLSCDDEVIRCTEDNLDLLFDLQKQYIIKEVAPVGKQISDLECRISLRQILKNQLVFALLADGELVSKVNTNAISWNFVQIGGVFTHPLFRKNYYAWHLLKVLCDRIQKTQKKIGLFVKEKNFPALKLYQRIGFTEIGFFEIAYYN